ncbi:MAG TPA: hypothetical protein VFP78_04285 [Solirubrobacteraceae bacterium]|nr:hypothetical protein [Solirubrobacteraceae bacterium]
MQSADSRWERSGDLCGHVLRALSVGAQHEIDSRQQEAMARVAVEPAVEPELPRPLLIAQRRVRPHQRLDLDGRVCDVVVGQRIRERGQHR